MAAIRSNFTTSFFNFLGRAELNDNVFDSLQEHGIFDEHHRSVGYFSKRCKIEPSLLGELVGRALNAKDHQRTKFSLLMDWETSTAKEDIEIIARALCNWNPVYRGQFIDGMRLQNHEASVCLKKRLQKMKMKKFTCRH